MATDVSHICASPYFCANIPVDLKAYSFVVSDVTKLGLVIEGHLTRLLTNHVILLDAPMGAGKTTFVSALASLMNAMITPSSPTFSIVNEYPLASKFMGYDKIVHMDLYRFETIEEVIQSGIDDYLYNIRDLVIIEWPQIIEPLVVEPYTRMHIEVKDNNLRKFVYLMSN